MSDNQPRLMEHEYDGIREYDNPTPGWWHMILWGTIVFGIFYTAIYHFSVFTPSIPTRWKAAQLASYGDFGNLDSDQATVLKFSIDEKGVAVGESIFKINCIACHASGGVGGTGPNLTDDHFLNVKVIDDLYEVISNGVVSNGMPAWGNRLSQTERVLLAAYVTQLRGNGSKGKAPEGEIIPAWPEPPAPEPADDAEDTEPVDDAPSE